ncbi:MAG: TonB-dependent receptor [Kiritimatiellales bacterium]|nr:TonB-dependent receptor [Kiritimatiellales bacterium]
MKNIFLTTLLAALAASAAETNEIPVITVTASAQTAENAAIHEVLRAEPGVVLNSQGGSQNDLSVRGSSFSGAGLSLGGLTLRNPQTEHFNAELPLPAVMLSRPSVFTGLDNQGGHLVGTVGFDLLPMSGKKQFEAGFGTDHRDWQSLLLQRMLSDTLGLGVFAGRESASGVDYPDNDYDREYVGGHLQFREDDTQIDLIIAHQEKEFGARGYYGVSDTLPADEKTDDTLIYLAARKGDLNGSYLRGGVSWHEFNDDYQLPTIGYRNQHRSRISSAFVDGRTLEVNGFALGWRTDVDEERVASKGSGPLGYFHRTRGGVSLLPQWQGDRLKIIAGVRGEFFTGNSPEYLPQLGAEYILSDNLTAFASYTETVRLPSYTELNYNSPGSLGNMGLKPQTTEQMEVGLKGIPSESTDWKVSAFHRRSKNTIDWMKTNSVARWTAADIGNLDVYGVEARLGWYPAQNLEMQFAYTWIYKDREAGDINIAPGINGYASRYALDYPEHLAQASLLWRPVDAVEIGTVQTLRYQTENNTRTSSDFGADSSFVVRYTPPKLDYATLALLINNAWDDNFQAFPGQRPPERYAGVSLTLNW